MVGPMFGAKPMAMPATPMTVARLFGGNEVMIMLIIMGMRIPAETAWSARPISSKTNDGANISTMQPKAKRQREKIVSLLSAKRRMR